MDSETVKCFSNSVQELTSAINNLKSELVKSSEKCNDLEEKCGNLEQYSRITNIIISNVPVNNSVTLETRACNILNKYVSPPIEPTDIGLSCFVAIYVALFALKLRQTYVRLAQNDTKPCLKRKNKWHYFFCILNEGRLTPLHLRQHFRTPNPRRVCQNGFMAPINLESFLTFPFVKHLEKTFLCTFPCSANFTIQVIFGIREGNAKRPNARLKCTLDPSTPAALLDYVEQTIRNKTRNLIVMPNDQTSISVSLCTNY